MTKEELIELKKVLKQYRNIYKTLYLISSAIGEEFLKKQEAYFKKKWSESHLKRHPNIPKNKMNTYKKQIFAIYDSFFIQSNLNSLLLFLEEKYYKIIKKGESQGMVLQEKEEKDLIY